MSRRGRGKGWTVIEALVALSLAAAILVFVSSVLRAGSRFSRMQSAVSAQQARVRISLRHLERILAISRPDTVSWLDAPDTAVLSTHPFRSGDFDSGPSWEPRWQCFIWNKSEKELRFVGTDGLLPAAPDDEPTSLTPGQLSTVSAGYKTQASRLLAERVTDFKYSLQPGPFFLVELEAELPRHENQTEAARGKIRTSRKFVPRN